MERTSNSVEAHLSSLPQEKRADMRALDKLISGAFAGLPRVMWEGKFWGGSEQQIIGYGELTQKRPRGADVEWFHVGLAAQKDGVSVYVNVIEDGEYLGTKYGDRLGKVRVGSASIGIRRLENLEQDVFVEMLERARYLVDEGL